MKILHKFKTYVMQRKLLKSDCIILCMFLFGCYVYYKWGGLYGLQSDSKVSLNDPYLVQSDGTGNVYAVDDERSRIIKIDSAKDVEYVLKSNDSDKDTFTYVEDLEFDAEGNIYILDAGWNESGTAVSREAILVYDAKGKYQDTLYEIRYESESVNKHKLYALSYRNRSLFFIESEEEGFYVCRVSILTKMTERLIFYEYEDAFDMIQDYSLDWNNNTVYALDKRGRILKGCEGKLTLLYDTATDQVYVGQTTLYRLAVGSDQSIYITDIKQNKLYRYKEGLDSMQMVIDQGQVLNVTCSTSPDNNTEIGILLDSEIYIIKMDSDTLREGPSLVIPQLNGKIFPKSSVYGNQEILFKMALLLSAVCMIWCIFRIGIILQGIRLSGVQKNGLLAAGTAAFVSIFIVTKLLNQFSEIYREDLISKLYILAHTVGGMVDGDSLWRIRASEDYMNEDYRTLMDAMKMGINRDSEFVREMYCNVLCYEDGKGFAIAYLDNSIGAYYPRGEEETKELSYIYDTGEDVWNEIQDDTGSYIYVCVPIWDSQGKIAGVVEVGMTTHVITKSINQMKQSVLVTLTIVIMLVMTLFGETLSFFEHRARYRKMQNRKPFTVPLHMLRLSIFVTYTAFNVASSFMPVYAAGFVTEDMGLPKELAASLPITFNLVCVGAISLFCAPLLRRFSFRIAAAAGAGISMLGDMTMFLGQSYFLLVLGLCLNGIGMGIVSNSINMFIAGTSQKDIRSEGFSLFNAGSMSGTSCGMMLGASLAGIVGQHNVFCFSALIWAIVILLIWMLGKYIGKVSKQEKHQGKKIRVFLKSPKVMPYMLLIQFPYVIINSFVYYYVPIYGDAMGFSESIVCLFLMLNSLCSVYLSVAVTNYMYNKFKKGSIYLSSALALSALLLFGFHSTVYMLLVVLLLLGFAGSFGVSVRQMYFTGIKSVQEYGEESAMGVYSLMDNLGGSVGPVLFGFIMGGANVLPGLFAFATVSGVLNSIYAIAFRDKKRKEREWKTV